LKTFVIGDVHACYNELIELEKLIDPLDEHEIWLTGDLFDRGILPHLVWDWLKKSRRFSIKGNHDVKLQWLIEERKDIDYKKFYHTCLDGLIKNGINPKEVAEYINKLPLLKEFDNHILVHAAIDLANPLKESEAINCFGNYLEEKSARFDDWYSYYSGEKQIAYGHHATKDGNPRLIGKTIGIDTACCHGGPLTAYCLNDGTIVQYKSGIDWFAETKKLYKD